MKYQNTQILLFLTLSLFLFSCKKLVELDVRENGGMLVELDFASGEESKEIIQKRLSDFYPDCNMEMKKVGEGHQYEFQIPTFISPHIIEMLIGGKGALSLAPQMGERLLIPNNEITDVRIEKNMNISQDQIRVVLSDEYGKKWETMTTSNIEKKITIIVDGMMVSNPHVNAPVTGGQFTLGNENKEYLKVVYSLLKNTTDNIKQPVFKTKLFIKDKEGAMELPTELSKEYYALKHGLAQDEYYVFQLIDLNQLLQANVKFELKEDIKRMIDMDLEGYLGHNKFNLYQFQDVMVNARKVYGAGLSHKKVMEERQLKLLKMDDGLPF